MQLISKETIQNINSYIPDRVRIFMFALYIWTYVLYYLTKFANFLLMLVISYLPNIFMPDVKPKAPVRVLKAVDETGFDITKKLNMFMKFKWDTDLCDDRGGIDLDVFSNYISSSIIWVSYILEYDINGNISNSFMDYIQWLEKNDKIDPSDEKTNNGSEKTVDTDVDFFKRCIRQILINTSKKVVYKIKKHTEVIESEDILFGEIDFY